MVNLLPVPFGASRDPAVPDLVVSNSTSTGSGPNQLRPSIFARCHWLACGELSRGVGRNSLVAIRESMELGLFKMVKSLHVQKSWVTHHLTRQSTGLPLAAGDF